MSVIGPPAAGSEKRIEARCAARRRRSGTSAQPERSRGGLERGARQGIREGAGLVRALAGETIVGGSGLVLEFAPNERHAIHARTAARLLLFLTPWPGIGHPGALTLKQKANARSDAAEHGAASASCDPGK